MKVEKVSASIRYSRALAQGEHKTVELSCEATLTASDDSWETAQQALYHRLGQQLKTLWNNGKDAGQEGHRIDAQLTSAPTPPKSMP
jgi:hypothetical protein